MSIDGNDFPETLSGTLFDDVINAMGGNDTINASQGNDIVDGGTGTDRLTLTLGNAALFNAPSGARTYTFTGSHVGDSSGTVNTSFASVERFTLSTVGAGDFNDSVDASGIISGFAGTVLTLQLGNGDDTVIGSNYNDLILTGLGRNVVNAGAGFDEVRGSWDNSSGATLYVTSSGGAVITTVGGIIVNSITNAEMVSVFGSDFNAALTRVDASGLVGFTGQLVFYDHNGTNIDIGSAGNDIFANVHGGEVGNDVYTGNGGADVFDYTFAIGAMDRDTITDLDSDDIIDLQFNDAINNGGGLLANAFIGSAAFSNVAGQYRYQIVGNTTIVQADTNGDGIADETLTIANGAFTLGETLAGSNQLHIVGTFGTNGDDFLLGTTGDDSFYALGGNDTIATTQGNDFVDGGAGYDQLRFQTAFADRFALATGSRTYTITNGHVGDSSGTLDTSFVNIESIFIRTIDNGNFGDTIDASALTSAGLILRLGNGNDTVIGGAGDDDLALGAGINSADAGGGFDTVYSYFDNIGSSTVYITSSGGTVFATVGGVQVASIVNAEVVQIGGNYASGTVTTIDASGYAAIAGVQLVLRDSNGSDNIIGSHGSDLLANVTFNVLGNDSFTGNGGADVFDYTYAADGINGDTITDFDSDDTIDFRFNNALPNESVLKCNQFIGSAAFSGVAGQYRYTTAGNMTLIQLDSDGDGVSDQQMTIANGAFVLSETFAGSNILRLAGLVITGTNGNDTLAGTLGDDIINTLGGRDTIFASQGHDIVDGGAGTADRLTIIMSDTSRFAPSATVGTRLYTIDNGHAGSSAGGLDTSFINVERVTLELSGTGDYGDIVNSTQFSGGALDIRLGNGDDVVVGGAGNETVWGRGGYNEIDTGAGFDSVFLRTDFTTGATVFITGSGNLLETVHNGVVTNTVYNAEQVYVGNDVDTTFVADGLTYTVDARGYTGDAQVVFYDHNGDDIFLGSAGSDIFSNLYNATIGNDTYTGGGGADVFDYTVAINALNNDVITDLDSDDTIDFQYNDGFSVVGQLLCTTFLGAGAFTGVAGQYRYTTSGGQTFVQVDTNGDSIADRTLTIANGQFALGETFAGSNILHIIGVSGTSGNDTLTGTLGNDNIYAQAGNDIINGSQGSDYIDGGNGGGDRLFMNTGTASLFTLATGARSYTIGNGTITDSSGTLNTSFTGVERIAFSTVGNGDFNDIINAAGLTSSHSQPLDIRLGNGNNQVTGSAFNDRVFTGYGSNIVDGGNGGYDYGLINVNAAGNVTVTITNVGGTLVTSANGAINQITNFDEVWVQGVGAGAVTLDASAYTDIAGLVLVLIGHNGSDIMIGSVGNDFFGNITGQVLGTDFYTGNGGADIYDYTYAADSMNGDTITDFDIDDVIDLRFNTLIAGQSPVLANQFIGAAAFSGTAGEYRYQINGTQTIVQVDSNGDTIVDQTLTIANGAFMLAETFAGSNILTLAAVIDPLAGIVADGYVEGATLFIDTNGNMLLDAGEAWTVTGVGGSFALNVNQAGTLVAVGGVNADTGLANTMTLAAPSGSGVVNPLTTLIQAVVEQGVSLAAAEAQVLAALGLDPTLDLLNLDLIAQASDPLATEAQRAAALAAQKAAAIIANIVAAAEGATGAGTSTEATLIDALAELVTGTTAGTTIDLTDAATLTPLLAEALPTTSNIAAIAASVAVEGDVIAAATSIAAISDAQVAVNSIDYSIDNIFTGDDAINYLFGGGGNDTLYGLGGNDFLDGGTGSDKLFGGAGNDRLIGGDGVDYFTGGSGNDIFVGEINATKVASKDGPMSLDVILDFKVGDKIDLRGIDANASLGGDQAFTFKGTDANKLAGGLSIKVYDSVAGAEKALGMDIDGVAGKSPYSGPVTVVYGNVDGGAVDFAIALIGTPSVNASDFFL